MRIYGEGRGFATVQGSSSEAAGGDSSSLSSFLPPPPPPRFHPIAALTLSLPAPGRRVGKTPPWYHRTESRQKVGQHPACRLPDQQTRETPDCQRKKVSHQRPSLERTKGKVFPPARACERTHLPHRHPSDRCNPVPGAPSYCFHLDSITSRQVVLDCTEP